MQTTGKHRALNYVNYCLYITVNNTCIQLCYCHVLTVFTSEPCSSFLQHDTRQVMCSIYLNTGCTELLMHLCCYLPDYSCFFLLILTFCLCNDVIASYQWSNITRCLIMCYLMLVGNVSSCLPLSPVQPVDDNISVFSSLVQVNISAILLLIINLTVVISTLNEKLF